MTKINHRPPNNLRPSGAPKPARGRPPAQGKKAKKSDPTQYMEEVGTAGDEMPSGGEESRRDAGEEALVRRFEESYRKDDFKEKTNAEDDASQEGKGGVEVAIPGPNTPQRKSAFEASKTEQGPSAASSSAGTALPQMDEQFLLNPAKKPGLEDEQAHGGNPQPPPEMQQQRAQDKPNRNNVYGSVIRKPGDVTRSSGSAPTAPAVTTAKAAAAAPINTSGPDRLGQAAPLKSLASSAPRPPSNRQDVHTLLKAGKPVGTFLSEYADNHPALTEEFTKAVSEAQRLMSGKKGIAKVNAGNYMGEPVIRLLVEHGLSWETLRALPENVRNVKAVISLPFGELPLKKRPLGDGK